MLRFKPGVRVTYFSPQLGQVLLQTSVWSLRAGIDVEVNSIGDDATGRLDDSFHQFDLALDLDTDGDRPEDGAALGANLNATLPLEFDVVVGRTHVHVEWDARKRRQIPMRA